MSWAKVKKINSNMDVPLDELIIGQKRYVATDTPLIVLFNKDTYYRTSESTFVRVGEFTPRLSGTLKLYGYIECSSSSYYASFRIVDSNGTAVTDVYTTIDKGEQYNEVIMNVTANTTYYLELKSSNKGTNVYVGDMKICGDIVDANWITGEGYSNNA